MYHRLMKTWDIWHFPQGIGLMILITNHQFDGIENSDKKSRIFEPFAVRYFTNLKLQEIDDSVTEIIIIRCSSDVLIFN